MPDQNPIKHFCYEVRIALYKKKTPHRKDLKGFFIEDVQKYHLGEADMLLMRRKMVRSDCLLWNYK